jgi:hypothetical protein
VCITNSISFYLISHIDVFYIHIFMVDQVTSPLLQSDTVFRLALSIFKTFIIKHDISYLSNYQSCIMLKCEAYCAIIYLILSSLHCITLIVIDKSYSFTGKVSDPESLLLYVGFDTPGLLTP